jgi:ABC-type dipeptide/oligopeptide/nickel transport system permease component
VWETAKQFAPNSLRLAFWAVILEIIIGLSVGIVSAVKRYSFLDTLTTLLTTVAMAIPVFVTGYLLIYVFGIRAFQEGWPEWLRFRTGGTPAEWKFLVFPGDEESFRRLVLPAVALAFVQIAVIARMMRATMLETINTDYVRTARAKGLTERKVVFKHGLRNALIPVVTLIGLDFGTMIGAAVLTETVFSYNGLGSAIVRAAELRDAPVVLGLTLVVVLAYLFVNLLVDLSYGLLDPRIRYDD